MRGNPHVGFLAEPESAMIPAYPTTHQKKTQNTLEWAKTSSTALIIRSLTYNNRLFKVGFKDFNFT
jgi:hypothetical protein